MSNNNSDYFRRQLLRYRDLLANFSKRNKELYFRPGQGSSLNLSVNPVSRNDINDDEGLTEIVLTKDISERREEPDEFQFVPLTISSLKMAELTKTSTIDLTEHFNLRNVPNPQIEKRLEKIRSADSRYQKEFGISGAWLLGPFLLWRESANAVPEDLLISPIFKLPVDLVMSKQKRWNLKVEESALGLNPSLQLALSKKIGLEIPDEVEAETIFEAVSLILSKLSSNKRQITVISTTDSEYRFADGKRLQPEQMTTLSPAIENALLHVRQDAAKKAKRKSGLKLPSILGKQKIDRDADGNIAVRRTTSLADDLPELEQYYYKAVSFEHFVIIDAFYIDHINATRMPLFRDYEKLMADLTNHQLITELLGQGPLPTGAEKAKLPRELDRYRERENFFVIPTDSSQHAAINLCSKSPAIVIQGPPGTGKSQTISNLIADKIAQGKKVLFVAEKRAALDVVYTRLRQAGIDKQAVLIHSSEINKKELYTSFLELADSKPCEAHKANWDRTTNKLDNLKEEIHGYYDVASQPFRDTGLTVSDVLTLFAANSKKNDDNDDETTIGSYFAKKVKGHDLDDLVSDLSKLQVLIKSLGDFENHPWINKKHDLVITVSVKNIINEVLSRISDLINQKQNVEEEVKSIFPSVSFLEMRDFVFLPSKPISQIIVNMVRLLLSIENHEEKQHLIKNQVSELMSSLENSWIEYSKFKNDVDQDLLHELKNYLKVPRSIFAAMSQSYWRMKRICRAVMKDASFKEIRFYTMDERPIKQYEFYKSTLKKLVNLPDIGFIWSDHHVQDASIENLRSTVNDLYNSMTEARALIDTVKKFGVQLQTSEIFFNVQNAKTFVDKVRLAELQCKRRIDIMNLIKQELSKLDKYFKTPTNWEIGEFSEHIEAVTKLLEKINDCDVIERIELICKNFGDRYSIPNFKQDILHYFLRISGEWGEKTKLEISRLWYDEVRSSYIQIRGFDRKIFEDMVQNFQKVEADHCEAARITVNEQFAQRWTSKAPDYSAIALLKKESIKQRRILYPREIMEKGALETMLRLKPCWLMSPLSVSQILPLVKGMFDIIVFDEASQVRVEDAIPAIYRASSMVVVGDPKQMPPTNFFLGGGGDESDEDDEEDLDLAESILDLSARIYPAQILEWHYRSRSEALIAFSNRAFYGGRLIAAPNPQSLGQDGSLSFVQVQDATFSQRLGNTMEAKAVIDHLAMILKDNPNQSVGVIAMGQSQRNLLDQTLEQRMENDKTFAAAVKIAESRTEGEAHVGLFIKNLENVQGDERDIILISVGYAPSKLGKKIYLNFGPLSRQGGNRRLNVAITRARSKVVLFCSFSPDDIPTDESAFSNNPDTACFGRYLKYVRSISSGQINEAQAILNSFGIFGILTKRASSNFSRDVWRRLRERGYEVELEVGSSGFFIDVAIHHPTIPGNFILGIECDGAMFHSTQYARDRDKAREQLLSARGWRIIRVWGPDWSRSWESEIERIEQLIKDIRNEENDFKHSA